jgi:hypothetical protein
MALIALAADKGAPGVTTAAVALSAVWPRRALLAEMDTAGGDLVYRSPATDGRPLDPNTGLLSLAATARRGLAAEQLWDHTQRLSGGLEVLVGLGNAEQSAGLAGQWDTVGRAFATLADSPHQQLAADVIADCGRIGPESASVALFPHAALVLLVARDEPEQIARVRDRAQALSARLHGGGRGMGQLAQPLLGVVLIARTQGAAKIAGQVNDMLVASRAGAQVVGVLAHDSLGAEQLAGRRRGRVERSLLVRSVRKIATDLHQQYGSAWSAVAQRQQPLTPGGPPQDTVAPSGNQPPGHTRTRTRRAAPAQESGSQQGRPAPVQESELPQRGPAPVQRPASQEPGAAPAQEPGSQQGRPAPVHEPASQQRPPAPAHAPTPQRSGPTPAQPHAPAPHQPAPGSPQTPAPQRPGPLPPAQTPPRPSPMPPEQGGHGPQHQSPQPQSPQGRGAQPQGPRGLRGFRGRRKSAEYGQASAPSQAAPPSQRVAPDQPVAPAQAHAPSRPIAPDQPVVHDQPAAPSQPPSPPITRTAQRPLDEGAGS